MARQKSLPGIEEKILKIPHITKSAREYLSTRDEIADLKEKLKATKERLLEQMKKEKLDYYYCEGQRIKVTHNDGLQVEKVGVKDDPDDASLEDEEPADSPAED